MNFLFPYTIPLSCFIGISLGPIGSTLTVFYVFGVLVILDLFLPKEELGHRTNWNFMEATLVAFPFLNAIVLFWAIHFFSTTETSTFYFICGALSVGLSTGGIGITVAHELFHRKQKWAINLALFQLLQVLYMHFRIEHIYGHHVAVGTPEDGASAKKGDQVYSFVVKSVFHSLVNSNRLERDLLGKAGNRYFSFHNRILKYFFLQVLFSAMIVLLFGTKGLMFFVIQACFGIFLLEVINFVEHYGLKRKRIADNRYESVQPIHSWDSPHAVTNRFLFNLGHHSDHHAHASIPFQKLTLQKSASQLPFGYPFMMLIALLPFAWRRVMDPRIPKQME